jgi:hypothetical protein
VNFPKSSDIFVALTFFRRRRRKKKKKIELHILFMIYCCKKEYKLIFIAETNLNLSVASKSRKKLGLPFKIPKKTKAAI